MVTHLTTSHCHKESTEGDQKKVQNIERWIEKFETGWSYKITKDA